MILAAAIACFGLAALCGTVRLLTGPGLGDRIMALDVLLISLMGGISVDAARRDNTTYMILPIVIAIIGFTATVAAARFLEHQGSPEANEPASDPLPGAAYESAARDRIAVGAAIAIAVVAAVTVTVTAGGDPMIIAAELPMLTGGFVALLAGIGVLRFSTSYARFHAAGKASPIAFIVAAIGAAISLGWAGAGYLLVAAVAMTLTLPVGVHLLFRAVYRTGDNRHLIEDDLLKTVTGEQT